MIVALLATAFQTTRSVPIESLDLHFVSQGWGVPRAGKSVDGRPMLIGGKVYKNGLGTHANSSFSIDLHRGAERFIADAGLDDETKQYGSIRFEVWGDGKRLGRSPVMRSGNPAYHFDIPLTGIRRLLLIVDEADNGIDYDHADWADARIEMKRGASAPKAIAEVGEPTMPIYTGTKKSPEFNGPRVVGCTPGRPFLFRLPVSGLRPMRFTVDKLPAGVRFNSETGIFSGRVEEPGSYPMSVQATNKYGKDTRTITVVAGDHKLALTPPMGWNSWNVWATKVTAQHMRDAADALINLGLADFGYRYVNIDDAWEGTRDANGEITTNEKFGEMAPLGSYVHSKGLLFGIYSSPGPKTCAGYEATYQHDEQDAKTYAKWGVDYLKYDWCSYGNIAPNPNLEQLQEPYIKMRKALDTTNRDIVFSLCQYGMGDVYKWGKQVGGNLWRTTGDITDSYGSMSSIAFQHSEKAMGASPGGWNDPDMLIVGWLGWGDKPRPTKLSGNEQITHITMWSLLAAPLILGCDLTKLDAWTKALITNHDVIEVDQDPLGKAATRILTREGGGEVWARPLYDGSLAVGLINRGRAIQRITVPIEKLGLNGNYEVRDLWMRKDAGSVKVAMSAEVPAHGAKLFRLSRKNH